MRFDGLRRLGVAAALAAAAAGAGGCGGDDGPDLDRLEGGRAEGPGFSFQLDEEWRSVDDLKEFRSAVADDIADDLPGLDASGFLFGGAWVDPGEDEREPSVNVVVEPMTADTSLGLASESSVGLIRSTGKRVEVTNRRARLGGAAAVAYTIDGGDHDTHALVAKRGPYGYSLSVRMKNAGAGELDALVSRIAASWRWREPSRDEARRLASLSEFAGTGYAVTLPPGWRGSGRDALRAGAAGAQVPEGTDSLWRGWFGRPGATNAIVIRRRAPTEQLGTLLAVVEAAERRQLGAGGDQLELVSLRRGPFLQLGGERAGSLELTTRVNGVETPQLEVVTTHDGWYYGVTLTARSPRAVSERREFLRGLRTWRWR